MWRRRGTVLRIPTPGKNILVPVCGAFRYPDGPFLYELGPVYKHPNTATFVGMLAKVATRARRTGKRIVLVLDNGTNHTSKGAQQAIAAVRDLVTVFWLPRYTSEQLNDIEGVWGHLKDDYFSRMLVTIPKAFPAAVVKLLDRLAQPGQFRIVLQPSRGMRKTDRKNFVRTA